MRASELEKLYNSIEIKEFISKDKVREKCIEAANWINKNYKDKHPIIIGTLKGAIPFMSEILKHLNIKVTMDFIMVKSYYKNAYSSNVKIYKDIDLDISDRDVIIIEDIVDSGKTLDRLAKLFKSRDVNSIAYISLITKSTNKSKVPLNFVGFEIDEQFVVGFGLDYAEMYRELPYIAEVNFKNNN